MKDHKEDLENIEKWERSVENLLDSIEASKRDYSKVIYALGIPFIGKYSGKLLAEASRNIDNLMKMEIEELIEIDGIGDKEQRLCMIFLEMRKILNL